MTVKGRTQHVRITFSYVPVTNCHDTKKLVF